MVDRKLSILERFNLKWMPEPFSGCWLWTDSVYQGRGYPYLSFKGRDLKGHRVSWELFRGPIPNGLHVLHKCDVRCCVNPDHLFLGTNADNTADCIRKGRARHPNGRDVVTAVICEDDVRMIRASTETAYKLAKRMPISDMQIRRIRRREAWAHVT